MDAFTFEDAGYQAIEDQVDLYRLYLKADLTWQEKAYFCLFVQGYEEEKISRLLNLDIDEAEEVKKLLIYKLRVSVYVQSPQKEDHGQITYQ